MAIEVGPQRAAIAAPGRPGKAQEQARTDAFDEGLVRGRGNVVTLVDDYVLPMVGAQSREQAACVEALHGREEVVEPVRVTPAREQLTEGLVAQDMAEGIARLAQEFFA